jgi:hypothetical protein
MEVNKMFYYYLFHQVIMRYRAYPQVLLPQTHTISDVDCQSRGSLAKRWPIARTSLEPEKRGGVYLLL